MIDVDVLESRSMLELELEAKWLQLPCGGLIERCRLGMILHTHCESPIEKILGVAVLAQYPEIKLCAGEPPPRDQFVLVPQYRWRGFRIDWALCASCRPLVFIECDGAEFHNTAAQLARDRRKDAEAANTDIHLLRFTGRDIHRHGDHCAQIAVAAMLRKWGAL